VTERFSILTLHVPESPTEKGTDWRTIRSRLSKDFNTRTG
jgi:hypothetical protein